MAHWQYIVAALNGPVGFAAWRYAPRAFLMIVGGLTTDPQRSKQCAEMVRLSRKDAKDLPNYPLAPGEDGKSSRGAASTGPRYQHHDDRPLNGLRLPRVGAGPSA
jgi:hypothetical protein